MGKVWSINNNFGENKRIKENYIFILSFILPMVIMFVVFTSLGVGFIGDKTIVSSDMYTQYVAYFGKFKDILSGDGSIFYSFNKSIGGNNIGLFAYYLASPLNLLLILFPKSAIGEFIFIIYLIKIGLASLCFSLYISKVYKKKDLFVVIFSLCYSSQLTASLFTSPITSMLLQYESILSLGRRSATEVPMQNSFLPAR